MTGENLCLAGLLLLWGVFSVIVIFSGSTKRILFGLIPLAAHLAFLILRSVTAGHVPFSNIYESLVLFGFLLFAKGLLFIRRLTKPTRVFFLIPGLAVTLIALLFPASLKETSPLAPALRSGWMLVHVPSIFWAYVSLTFASGLALRETIRGPDLQIRFSAELREAFFFLGVGIITGAFWADESWGTFWSWDPKETWSLVTWILTAFAFHLKNKRLRAITTCLAFGAMLFTYFGVTLLLPGLHSYLR